MRKRMLAWSLIVILILSALAGCADGGESSTAAQSSSQSTSAAGSSGTEPAPADGTAEKEGNLFLTGTPIVEEKVTYSVIIDKSALDKSSAIADKELMQQAEAETNVAFDWQEIPSSGWKDRINIVLASGDLPDVIMGEVTDFVPNIPAFREITDDEFSKYMPNLAGYLAENPTVRSKMNAPDGKVYSIPNNSNYAPWNKYQDGLYINTDWLEKIGKPMPTTTDEFYETLKAAQAAGDLNGNGAADEIMFGFAEIENGFKLGSMYGPWGVISDYNNYVMVKDGKVIFAPSEPGYYEGLKYLNTLFSEGLMDPEGFSQPRAQYNAKSLQDVPVYFVMTTSTIGNAAAASQQDSYAPITPLKGPDGTQLTRAWSSLSNMNVKRLMITKNCEDPYPFMRWLDWWLRDLDSFLTASQGQENVGWKHIGDDPWTWSRIITPVADGYASNDEYRYTVGFQGETYLADIFDLKYTRDLSEDRMTLDKLTAADAFDAYYEKEKIYTDLLIDPELTGEISLLFADIDTYVKSFAANSITTGITDEQWQAHLAQMEALRIPEYISLYQQVYDTQPK